MGEDDISIDENSSNTNEDSNNTDENNSKAKEMEVVNVIVPEDGIVRNTLGNDIDVTNAVMASLEDSEEIHPTPFGEWAEYSVEDGKSEYCIAYARLTNITTESENAKYVSDCMDKSIENAERKELCIQKGDLKLQDYQELAIVDYEIYIPEDTFDWGKWNRL